MVRVWFDISICMKKASSSATFPPFFLSMDYKFLIRNNFYHVSSWGVVEYKKLNKQKCFYYVQ